MLYNLRDNRGDLMIGLTINTHCQIIKDNLALQAATRNLFMYVYLNLIFDSKVILVIRNLCFYLNTISNRWAKYEHIPSKHERVVRITNFKEYLTLTFDSNVINCLSKLTRDI